MKGKLYIVSVGPGDPELMTCKAVRVLNSCPVIAAPKGSLGNSIALEIASQAVDLKEKKIIYPEFPMSRDAEKTEAAHETALNLLLAELEAGQDTALLSIGDVSVYSTSMYLSGRVSNAGYAVEVVPGVPSFCAAAAALQVSLTEQNEPLVIVPSSGMPADEALSLPGTKVLMKSGKQYPAVCAELEKRGLLGKTALAERVGLPGERLVPTMEPLPEQGGYFTLMIVKE